MQYQSGAVRPVGSIEDGWKIISDDYWTFFSMTLVAIVILVVAAVILGLINNVITLGISTAFGAASGAGSAAKATAAILPQLISMVISFFTNIVVAALSGTFFCGIYMALARKAKTGAAEFGDLFAGFQKFQPCLIAAAVLSFVQFVIGVVTLIGGAALGVSAFGLGMLTTDGQLNPAAFGGLFLVILAFVAVSLVINLIISALTAFVYPLIADRNLPGGEALLVSAKSGLANFGGLLLLLILLTLMFIGGALLCLVGMLFVAPIFAAALFAAYQSVFGTNENFYQQAPPAPPVFNNQPGF